MPPTTTLMHRLCDWVNSRMKSLPVYIDDDQLHHLAALIGAAIAKELDPMSQAIDDLADAVKANNDVVQSAVVLIQGLADEVAAAAGSGDPQAVADLTAQIRASAQALADAVSANTPSAPVDPNAPAPVDPNAPVINPLAP